MTLKLYLLIGGAVALLALGAFGGWKSASWRASGTIATQKADVARLTAERDDCANSLGTQTAAVVRWQATAAEQTARAVEAEGKTGQVRVVWRDKIVEVTHDAPPRDAPCHDAALWAAAQYRGLRP